MQAEASVLFCPEPAIEAAIIAAFQAADIPAYSQRGREVLPIPRADVRLNLGGAREKLRVFDGHQMRHSWDSTLEVNIVTKRGSQAAENEHRRLVGQCRYELSAFGAIFTAQALPLHEVPSLFMTGSEQSTNEEDDTDTTSMTFSAAIGIR